MITFDSGNKNSGDLNTFMNHNTHFLYYNISKEGKSKYFIYTHTEKIIN